MIKHTGIALLLGLGGFALGGAVARVTEKAGAPAAGATPPTPPALRHISQLPPPPPAAGKHAAGSGR